MTIEQLYLDEMAEVRGWLCDFTARTSEYHKCRTADAFNGGLRTGGFGDAGFFASVSEANIKIRFWDVFRIL